MSNRHKSKIQKYKAFRNRTLQIIFESRAKERVFRHDTKSMIHTRKNWFNIFNCIS